MKQGQGFPGNHKRVKKKLIAPMNHLFQDRGWNVTFVPISHEQVMVPEIFWITYLNDKIGINKASEVMLKIIQIANEIHSNNTQRITGLASSFNRLDSISKTLLIERLDSEGIIDILNENLSGIKHLFADFPLNFLIIKPGIYKSEELGYLKKILTSLNDRLSKETTFTFAHLIYPLVLIGLIQMKSDSKMLKTQELLNYPDTEESQIVASHLRASSKLVDKSLLSEDIFGWRKSFWCQCFKLEPCKI